MSLLNLLDGVMEGGDGVVEVVAVDGGVVVADDEVTDGGVGAVVLHAADGVVTEAVHGDVVVDGLGLFQPEAAEAGTVVLEGEGESETVDFVTGQTE